MIAKGMFNASPLFYVYKSATTVALGAVAMLMVTHLQWYYISAILLGLCYQQLGWLAHDYCHHQVRQCPQDGPRAAFILHCVGRIGCAVSNCSNPPSPPNHNHFTTWSWE